MIIIVLICFILGIVLTGFGIYFIIKIEADLVNVSSLISGILIIFLGITALCGKPKPTDEDVMKGKAIYQETIHVIGNDSVSTYKIVWKEKKQ